MSSRNKWRCSACTYENWPAALKCTLCRTPRASSLLEDEVHRLQVSTKELDNVNTGNDSVPSDTDPKMKCPSCTYLNKPQSFKCEQCFHVLCDPPDLDASVPKPASSVSVSSVSPSVRSEQKWTCPLCTYENWPKSKHCIMCHGPCPPSGCSKEPMEETTLRDINSPLPSIPSGVGTKRSKPTSSFNLPVTLRDKLWLGACKAVLEGEVTPIERYILTGGRMERRLSKQECRYLDSVAQPVAVGESSLVTSELESNVRQPSDENLGQFSAGACASDSSLAPEEGGAVTGSKIRAGLTLVDLAIRFGRADLINLFIALSGLQATSAAVSIASSRSSSRGSAVASQSQEASAPTKPNSGSNRRTSGNLAHLSLQQIIARAPSLLNKSGVARSKWMPCQASPHIAKELRDVFTSGIKYHIGDFPCAFLSEWGTFALPYSVAKLPAPVKYLLLSELCDTQAQAELEDDAKAINWWFIPGQKQASRLFALWNRTAGDCLLDSVLQACWGIFDRDNYLRRTLAESLRTCEASFYSRWRDYEALQAACHYILDETQCRRDWDNVLAAAGQPGGALEQIHIFALSHILRRPIIVYGVKYIKNYRDEPIGIANFQGIYIPLLWERNFCSPNPIVLGYTRGHFTALVPMEPQPISIDGQVSPSANSSPFTSPRIASSSSSRKHSPTPPDDSTAVCVTTPVSSPSTESQLMSVSESLLSSNTTSTTLQNSFIYLPLVDRQGGLLPIHFTTEKEANLSQTLLRDWLDVVSTPRGLPLARLRLGPRHPLVDRMTEEWLDSYRSLARFSVPTTSFPSGSLMINPSRDSEKSSSSSSLCSESDVIEKPEPSECHHKPAS